MNHREVMQQALEALKNNAGEARVEGAINILEAALAEPQEPVAWLHKDAGRFTVSPLVRKSPDWQPLYTHPAPQRQPQEPTIDGYPLWSGMPQRQPQEPRWDGDDNIESPHNACMHKGYCLKLKAQAPQRQPLSDEEIDRVTDAQWAANNHKPVYAAHRAFARAIEAAHGIGGQR